MSLDTITITKPQEGAPEGHDQKMIDLVDKASAPPEPELPLTAEPEEDRPDWLDKKFKSPEDLAKAYSELEKKLGGKPDPVVPDAAAATADDANTELTAKGLNLQDFSAEFSRTGELSAESYEKLSKAGYNKDLVDTYIEGQRARATQYEAVIKTEAGGDDNYDQMVSWAKANLEAAEIDAYNNAVSSGNLAQAKLAVSGLSSQYVKANGSEPKLFGGKASGSTDESFESIAQVTEAMKDPRYKTDSAYRNKVQSKLGRSNVF